MSGTLSGMADALADARYPLTLLIAFLGLGLATLPPFLSAGFDTRSVLGILGVAFGTAAVGILHAKRAAWPAGAFAIELLAKGVLIAAAVFLIYRLTRVFGESFRKGKKSPPEPAVRLGARKRFRPF